MDPITVLQNRIEQLEAKLGLAAANAPFDPASHVFRQEVPHQQGDVTNNLVNTHQTMQNVTAGLEKVPQAMNMASELNNYTNPNLVENMQQNQMQMQEVAAAENAVRQHCHCMHRCKQRLPKEPLVVHKCELPKDKNPKVTLYQVAPVLQSEPIQQVPQMQPQVEQMQAATNEVKAEADAVAQGVNELAETCGQAAAEASEQLANVAQKVETTEQKMFPKRRNGLD